MSGTTTAVNRKLNTKKVSTEDTEVPKSDEDEKKINQRKLKFGPLPSFRNQRVWTRAVLFISLFIVMYFYKPASNDKPFAKQKEFFHRRGQEIACSETYAKEVLKYPSCAPFKCGRYVTDSLVTLTEVELLVSMAKRGLALGGSSGGASVIDFHSGILSYNDKFVDFYKSETGAAMVTKQDLDLLKSIEQKLKHAVAETYRIDSSSLYLTYPTLFSELTNIDPVTVHDEYWHPHIDMVTYDSFFYTTLLYLTDYEHDFKGGRFFFMDSKTNYTVEPRKGRVLMFTSGAENEHYVERVAKGKRYALTVAFTCDISKRVTMKDLES